MLFCNSSITNNVNQVNTNLVIRGTGEVLEDCSASGRRKPWERYKMGNEKLFKLYKLARERDLVIMSSGRLASLSDCASWLLFNTNENGQKKLAQANFCRFRTCPMCGWRRRMKLYSQVTAITDSIMARQDGTRFIFLTLTIQNVEGKELKRAIDKLNKGWKYLTSKAQKFAPAKKLQENLLGYMKAIEITYNQKQDTYHPHIHAVLEVEADYFASRNYISRRAWAETWQKAIKVDYVPSVDVKAIDCTVKAVAEVAKYPVKLDGVLKIRNREKAAEVLAVIHNAIFNKRLITFGGDIAEVKRKLALDDVEMGDLTHVESENEKGFNAVAQILFRYQAGQGVYIC